MISAVSLDHRKLKLQKASRFTTKKQHATEIIRSYILQFTAQSIPSVPFPPTHGHLPFCFGKLKLPIPHGGAGRFIQKLHGGTQQLGATAPP